MFTDSCVRCITQDHLQVSDMPRHAFGLMSVWPMHNALTGIVLMQSIRFLVGRGTEIQVVESPYMSPGNILCRLV
jgi:hypothetical protein